MPPARKPAVASTAELAAALEDALFQIKRVVVGQERLIERVKGLDGMWVTTLAEIARHTKDTIREVHSHARIDIPLFPGAGATFRPAEIKVPTGVPTGAPTGAPALR